MRRRPTLNLPLTPELVACVGGHVRTGRDGSASEVVRAALRLLQREEPSDDGPVLSMARKPRPKARSDG